MVRVLLSSTLFSFLAWSLHLVDSDIFASPKVASQFLSRYRAGLFDLRLTLSSRHSPKILDVRTFPSRAGRCALSNNMKFPALHPIVETATYGLDVVTADAKLEYRDGTDVYEFPVPMTTRTGTISSTCSTQSPSVISSPSTFSRSSSSISGNESQSRCWSPPISSHSSTTESLAWSRHERHTRKWIENCSVEALDLPDRSAHENILAESSQKPTTIPSFLRRYHRHVRNECVSLPPATTSKPRQPALKKTVVNKPVPQAKPSPIICAKASTSGPWNEPDGTEGHKRRGEVVNHTSRVQRWLSRIVMPVPKRETSRILRPRIHDHVPVDSHSFDGLKAPRNSVITPMDLFDFGFTRDRALNSNRYGVVYTSSETDFSSHQSASPSAPSWEAQPGSLINRQQAYSGDNTRRRNGMEPLLETTQRLTPVLSLDMIYRMPSWGSSFTSSSTANEFVAAGLHIDQVGSVNNNPNQIVKEASPLTPLSPPFEDVEITIARQVSLDRARWISPEQGERQVASVEKPVVVDMGCHQRRRRAHTIAH